MHRNLCWERPKIVFADYPRIIKSIAQPTLVLIGKNDPFVPIEHAKRLANDIKDSSYILLDNASHFLPIDVPEVICDKMGKFLTAKS